MAQPTQEEIHKIIFVNLVMMVGTSAMQQLGKLMNPMTNKTEVNLEAAQASIDMLEMLQAKTKGNLDKEEERMLRDTLSSLQMNYFETAQSQPQPEQKPAEAGQPEPAKGTEEPPQTGPGRKDPKFHKTYG